MKRYLRIVSSVVIGLLCSTYGWGQMQPPAATNTTTEGEFRIKGWQLSEYLGDVSPTLLDTTHINFHQYGLMDGGAEPKQHIGPKGLASQSRLFFNRERTPDFLFSNVFADDYLRPTTITHYQTTIPYASLNYISAGSVADAEEQFRALFTMNAGKRINMGGYFDLLGAKGFYNEQAGNSTSFSLWGSYRGDKYSAHLSFNNNNRSNKENGGITDDQYIKDPVGVGGGRDIRAKDIPTNLQGAFTRVKGMDLFLTHRYNVGFSKTDFLRDSISDEVTDTIETFVPVTAFIHTLRGSTGAKEFVLQQKPQVPYFANYYLNPNGSRDSSHYASLINTLAISMCEGFSKYVPFGLSVYAQYEVRDFQLMNPYSSSLTNMTAEMIAALPAGYEAGIATPDSRMIGHTKHSFYAGAELQRRQGKLLNFDAALRIGVLGYDAGLIDLRGGLQTTFPLFKEEATLRAEASFLNSQPNFFYQQYVSNHFIWKNNFVNEQRLRIQGLIKLERLKLQLRGGIESIQNHVYMNSSSLPQQEGGNIQVASLQLGKQFKFGVLHLDVNASGQVSSNPNIINLPALTVYANLYISTAIAKVLKTQIGIDAQYFTKYNAPAYQPGLNQFVTQNSIMVGDYPLLNVYADFRLKQARFYLAYTHANQGLFGGNNAFASPHHPYNPAMLKLGISWSFID